MDAWFYYDETASTLGPELSAPEVAVAFGQADATFLGRGGFGETWKVGPNAAKLLKPTYPVARVQREIDGLVSGACPNVVRLLKVDLAVIGAETRPYLLFEFIEGGDTSRHLAQGHRPSEPEVIQFGIGLFEALVALHQAAAIHRDVKPENIALRRGDWADPVLLDFGLTRFADSTTLTLYPGLVGTPAFMSPEQIRGERARKGSDVWAAGAVLYLLLAGKHPFYGGTTEAVDAAGALALVDAGAPPLPPTTQPKLAALVMALVAPEPHQRGSSRRALAALRGLRGG